MVSEMGTPPHPSPVSPNSYHHTPAPRPLSRQPHPHLPTPTQPLGAQVACAVDYMHACGVVHRDLKVWQRLGARSGAGKWVRGALGFKGGNEKSARTQFGGGCGEKRVLVPGGRDAC